ncbi:MetQ/NlpA family ABC transporter substrate-binding protein [Paenibacillus sp. GCM10023252]|uniref:MetQ/NlpA family ABC transporter substrate-binding protein n=1 Tax=Paenibacillus sp. GCM10023252 TaxID=3252649 RepID=UPI00360DF1E9
MKFTRTIATLIAILLVTSALAACGKSEGDDKALNLGFFPGPYADLFKRGVQPILEKEGYKITITEFTNALQPNTSLSEGKIDANIYQHAAYLESYKEQQNAKELSELIKIPSAPAGIYSKKFKSLDELKDGAIVSLPNDPSNLARSLVLLQTAGLIKLKDGFTPLKASEKDIVENSKNLTLKQLEAPGLPRSLDDVDFAVIPGSNVIASGLKLAEALLLEDPAAELQIIVAVNEKHKDSKKLTALADAYKSDEFKQFIASDDKAKGFSTPSYWK